MRTKDLFDLVRHKVNDKADSTNTEGRYHTNRDIGYWVNVWARELLNDQVEADRSWHNSIITLNATDAVQDSNRSFVYTLPPYVYRISLVRENNTTATHPLGRKMSPVPDGTDRRGWYWRDSTRMFIQGETAALDLKVWATKVPPKVHFGEVRVVNAALDKFYLDHQPALTGNDPLEISPDDNAYVDTYFIFTGTTATPLITRDLGGEVRRCTSSARVWEASLSQYVTEITLDRDLPFATAVGDTYEMVVPIADPHTGYLALLVAESLHHRTNNTKGIEALQPQKAELHSRFINGIQPRQDQEPWENLFPEELQVGDFDPDRDPWALYYGTTF